MLYSKTSERRRHQIALHTDWDLRHCGHMHLPQPLLAPSTKTLLYMEPRRAHVGHEILKVKSIHSSFGQW